MQQIGGDSDLLLATGNVEIIRGGSRLVADRVEINRATGEAVAQGKAVFFDGEDRLVGERIDFNLNTGTGVVYKGSTFVPPYYRLSADRMDRLGEGVYSIRQGIFTTCEGDDPAWSFRLGSAQADLEDLLTGTNTSFLVKGVPVIPWVPFFAASIRRERQSGFLFPEFGSNSRYGFLTRTPYYWAINDSQDLTFALDVYTKRGIGADLDYRYILSRDTRGQLTAFGFNESFLNSAQSAGLPENRGYVKFEHHLAGDAEPVLQAQLQRHVRRHHLQDLRLDDRGPGPADRRDERLRHPALEHVQPGRPRLLVPGPDADPRGRAPAGAGDQADEPAPARAGRAGPALRGAGVLRELRPRGRLLGSPRRLPPAPLHARVGGGALHGDALRRRPPDLLQQRSGGTGPSLPDLPSWATR